jgi:hypothetical protein
MLKPASGSKNDSQRGSRVSLVGYDAPPSLGSSSSRIHNSQQIFGNETAEQAREARTSLREMIKQWFAWALNPSIA